MDLKEYLDGKKGLVEGFLRSYLSEETRPPVLREAMRYSLLAGGKRLRPILCLASYEACGGSATEILPYASALEFVHTYSLIHDDLPAMDNDDLRRGKPTNHKVYGEAIAILAGDALLTEAFVILSDASYASNINAKGLLKALQEVAKSAGVKGMVGGQAQDILSEQSEPDPDTLYFIHTHKTAALISASVKTGGLLYGCGDDEFRAIQGYGDSIGLAFQIIDDVLDVEGTTAALGKTAGSDAKKRKITYPALYGIGESKGKARELIGCAIDSLHLFAERAEPLRLIAEYMLRRSS